MELQQVLNMLKSVSGPNGSGEFTAKCPAHQDRTASLTLTQKQSAKDGKTKIYLCCHAGCTNAAVLGALGITAQDLIVDPDPAGRPGGRSTGSRSGSGKGGRSTKGRSRSGTSAADRAPTDDDAPPEEPRALWGPDEPMYDPETGEVVTDQDGNPIRVRTVDEQGRPLDVHGEVIPGETAESLNRKSRGNGSGTGGTEDAKAEKKDQLIPDWAHPDAVYSYTDEDGQELFQVVRLHYKDGKPGKTFRQRMKPTAEQKAAAKAGKIKISREGYVNSVPAELRDSTLYRLPAVMKAIADGKPVFVVEGEKDVETLERLGHAATCNPGGAGKWREGYSRRLTGADVIILPDNDGKGNDFTGQNHALDVALKLKQYAKRVRLVDIKEACPDLPEKGDISDMVAIMGDVDAMDALARQISATRDFDPGAVPFWLSPVEQAERLYGAVRGYGVRNGCICKVTGNDETKPLTDFVVLPRMELERDDGVNVSKHFVLDGWNAAGRKLGRVVIRAADLDGMNWVTEKWGFDAGLMPGSTTKGNVAWAIKKVGQMTAKHVTEYNHTGWRKIGGKWCYLYHGGAIGMDGITVDMGDALKNYRIDGGGVKGFDEIPFRDAAAVSLQLQDVMKEEIGIALLGTVYLAPLREWMSQTDIVPAFALFLYGESGTHKTTAAALAMSHFGNFHAKNPPASFNDTGNQIRKKAFLVKDMPILVDDYHPVTSVQEKRQMAATAQTLSRAFGDGVDRGRLNADSTIKANTPPRSVAIITGEDLPAIGASGLARYFILDIDRDDIPVGKELTDLQEKARNGLLQRAMNGYIRWLLQQADGMPQRLHDLFLKFREDLHRESRGQHDRAPETVACIMIGYQMMLEYMRGIGLIDLDTAVRMLAHARGRLMEASGKQARDMESEKPTRIFLDSLAELMNSKQAAVKDLTAVEAKDPPPTERMIGYVDNDYYYLLPNVAFGAVQKLCREQGQEFPVSLKALYKHLRTDRILRGTDSEKATRTKWIGEKNLRLLWIPVSEINGPKATAVQMQMTPVEIETPFDGK